ncbi:MAG: hypothetical protein ABSG92_03590 [Conexivisphaerales archaeon]
MKGTPVGSIMRWSLAVVLVVGLAAGLALLYVNQPPAPTLTGAKTFTIMADEDGYNGSVQHGIPWPIITVHQGDNVTITVINDGKVEAHGFVIDQYFPQGFIIGPGENDTVSFTANISGNFTFYCNVFCTVHPFMVGVLVVEK